MQILLFCANRIKGLCSPNTSQSNHGSEVIEQKRLNEPLKRHPNGCTPNRYLFSLNIKNTHRFETEMAPRALHAILERFSPYHGAFLTTNRMFNTGDREKTSPFTAQQSHIKGFGPSHTSRLSIFSLLINDKNPPSKLTGPIYYMGAKKQMYYRAAITSKSFYCKWHYI